MNNPRDPPRLRQALNPLLTTSLGGPHQHQVNTPLSAVSLTSSHLYASTQPTPTGSAIQPYNPQEWIGSPAASADRGLPFPDGQNLISAPPPPPYSPPWNQRPPSGNLESSASALSAATARMSSASTHRPSPEPSGITSFPPPPGVSGRGNSRERRFGLPSLRRHKEPHEQSSPPEPVPPVSLLRAAPSSGQIPVAQPLPQRTDSGSSQGPPGARRATSASAIETPTSARSRPASQAGWDPGMPLPPPPPCPPPASSRSQSAQSVGRTTSNPIVSPATRRPPPSNGSALGPVPPTPADWTDQGTPKPTHSRGRSPNLTIDTAGAANAQLGESSTSAGLGSAGLSRAGAVRHDKTIVQRRTESRTRQPEASEGLTQPGKLSTILVPSATMLSERRTVGRSTPRSGERTAQDTPQSGESSAGARNTTPKGSVPIHKQHVEAATPPFSPHPQKGAATSDIRSSVVPKALPTPPPQSRSASSSQSRVLATPIDGVLSSSSSSNTIPKQLITSQTEEQFCRGTVERFQAFAAKEASAGSDGERVRLFADFIVSESRIRRERYSSAIGAMGSEIFDLTRDLFRPMATRRESGVFAGHSEFTPHSSEPSRSHRGSMNSTYRDSGEASSSSAPASANVPKSPVGGPPSNVNWQSSNYMPSLSPILSLSVSGNGDGSSRGRPPSRWWETDSAGQAVEFLERTKRESKYMGVPKQAREALQWSDSPGEQEGLPSLSEHSSSSSYPLEKTGWHNQEQGLTPQAHRDSDQSLASPSSPATPNPAHLDISRLITLPPPYPRHHPAVNNNHPELTETRAAVRQISDLTEVGYTKERFSQTSRKKREEASQAAAARRAAVRSNLQQEINAGNMTFAEASTIEQDSADSEKETLKELAKADFEHFQSQVVMPLNELLTNRIAKATTLFDELASGLFDGAESAADMPQEEGDDKPELLEKLALLKWIFETREMLHRAIYDLLSDRNDRYRDVVLTPYRLANNEEKVRSGEAFFADDAAKRQLAFAKEVMARTRALQSVVEQNVVRGVEAQLSAFWDIAPPLRLLLDEVPADLGLAGFGVQVPAQEYQENPSYRQHPLQYLYSLLLHAEKSSYQFIEAQTNLLCKLHEVNEAVANARAKVMESEAVEDGSGEDLCAEEREQRAEKLRQDQERRLTADLKEKVQVVQGQWQSALGEHIKVTKQAVGEWLLQTGGWEESLEEGGVGSE